MLLNILSIPTYILFGELGSNVFYGGLIFLSILILSNENLLNKGIFFKFLMIEIIICAILNFQLLENQKNSPDQLGGRTGYLLLKFVAYLLDGQETAIKILFIFFFLAICVWIIVAFNIKVMPPQIALDISSSIPNTKKGKSSKINSTSTLWNYIKPSKININEDEQEQEPEQEQDKKEIKLITENKKEDKQSIPIYESKQEDKPNINIDLKQELKNKILEKFTAKIKERTQIMKHQFPKDKPTFDINILEKTVESPDYKIDTEYLDKKAQALVSKLKEFEIDISIEGYNIGPSVVQIKIKPEAGIKISKIENLKNDITLALKIKSLRILAPIPGTGSVGIEIPNPKPSTVRLGDILGANEFTKSMSKNFTNLALGKGIDGAIVIKSLEEMPHLLIAGATGSGKSVGVNDFILSLIYQNSPTELKFILVDPKQVELSIYEGIPHLLAPIITEPEKAIKVLKWAVVHMDERYNKLKQLKVRNIYEYNDKVSEDEKLYRIIIIIDELADFMMSGNKKESEIQITRIAQKARAVGMHLILATQRPSVNVITGLIKANLPTRISFGVKSQIDSRTILDMKGAEDLVGKGDMLYTDPGYKFPIRVQAPYVTTIETEKIVEAIKEKYMHGIDESDIYDPEIINILNSKTESVSNYENSDGEDDEEIIQKAIELIMASRKASATMLQRKLGIGFPRAAKVMDILEERGIVGPQDGAKPREIRI